MTSFRLLIWILLAVAAAGLGWFTVRPNLPAVQEAEAPFGVPFSLVDQKGQAVTEQAFRKKPTALFFGYTHCPDVCPTTLFELDGWLKKVDPAGDRLQAYFVTVDPERDTPELLGRYVSNVSERITGLSGPPDRVMEMVKGFRVYAKKVPVDESQPNGDYTMDHTASVFLLDSGGRFAGTIAYQEDPDTAAKKLERLAAR